MAIIKNPIIIKQESGGGVDHLDLRLNQTEDYTYENNVMTVLPVYLFFDDFHITSISSTSLLEIRRDCFTNSALNTSKLTSINFPSLTTLRNSGFYRCSALTNVSLPSLTTMEQSGFAYCSRLTTVDLGPLTSLPQWAFANCDGLTTLTIRNSNVCSLLNTNALPATSTHHINIYVPANLIDSYKTASNWVSLYNNNYISFYPIAGTSFNITTSVTNGSYSGATTIVESGTATVTLTANSGYDLPSSITVTGASYTYNSTTGVVSLSSPTGNVSITAVCTQQVSGYTVSVASFGSSPYGHGHTYYSLDDGSTWIEITGAGTLTTSATQVKFKATSDDYMMESVKLASTTLGLTLYNDYWNAGISSNYTLSSNVTDITIEFYDID